MAVNKRNKGIIKFLIFERSMLLNKQIPSIIQYMKNNPQTTVITICIDFECFDGESSPSKNISKNFFREDFIFTFSHFEKVTFLYCYMFWIGRKSVFVNKIAKLCAAEKLLLLNIDDNQLTFVNTSFDDNMQKLIPETGHYLE